MDGGKAASASNARTQIVIFISVDVSQGADAAGSDGRRRYLTQLLTLSFHEVVAVPSGLNETVISY